MSWSKSEIKAICLDFDLAVLDHIEWIERRDAERDEIVAPSSKSRPTIQVPRYKTVEELLALNIDIGAESRMSSHEIAEAAKEYMSDPEAARKFLHGG